MRYNKILALIFSQKLVHLPLFVLPASGLK